MQTRTEPDSMTETHMENHADLWARYWAGDRDAYEALVEAYLPLVKITVGRMSLTIPAYVSRDDLYSAGTMGLLSAVERYDATREAKFTTYAITRVRGAILDELRAHDLLGRVTRERVTRIQAAENKLHNEGRELTPDEVAAEAGLSLDEYWDAEMGALATHQLRLSEVTEDGEHTLEDLLENQRSEEPGHSLEVEEVIDFVQDLLTEKEKLLVVLYYKEGLTLKEIGTILQVSESRVCQLHTAMAVRLRKKLETKGILF